MATFNRYQGARTSGYPSLREALAPEYRGLPAEDIEALFESYNLSAEDIEGFFDTLKDIGKAVVKVAPAVLPVAGTVVGTAFGGPLGGALGGALGQAAGGAIGQATGAGAAGAMPGLRPPVPGGSPAAGGLMQTMFRPEMIQSLLQMLLGRLGGSNVKVGSTPVPVGGMANLLGSLLGQAQAEFNATHPPIGEGLPGYMADYAGEAMGDPALAEHRARALYELLQETDVGWSGPRRAARSRPTAYAEADGEEEAFYRAVELAEFNAELER